MDFKSKVAKIMVIIGCALTPIWFVVTISEFSKMFTAEGINYLLGDIWALISFGTVAIGGIVELIYECHISCNNDES